MWRILSAEVRYNRFAVLFCLLLPVSVGLGLSHWHAELESSSMARRIVWNASKGLTIVFALLLLRQFVGGPASVAERLHFLLPVSLLHLGLRRLAYPPVLWGSVMVACFLFVPFGVYGYSDTQAMKTILFLNGLLLIVNAIFTIGRDLVLGFRIHHTIGKLLPIAGLAALLVLISSVRPEIGLIDGYTELVGLNLVGFMASAVSLLVFVSRRSFADALDFEWRK